ncbi:MAG: hypothetical protein XD98_0112 [Microgenomates bacterium 39_6]|nr:MAG: hypothetical protein XD98_0112 [Microgenomates bacterium 39_6]
MKSASQMKKYLSQITLHIKEHYILLAIIFFVFFSRLLLIYEGIIPFSFDHGKDSLAILHMAVTKTPSLIGPWTSIPGLFFGPGWYYLLLPFYLIGGSNPVVAVWAVIILLLVQVYLMYRYVSKWGALILATAPYWFTISTSAWNPFPMSLISLLLIIILKKLRQNSSNSVKLFFWLGFVVSLGFHFSSAFAFFYPFIILFILVVWKIKFWSIKLILVTILGFVLPFLPQIAFDFRHNLVQTDAVINYFLSPPETTTPASIAKLISVFTNTWGEVLLAFLPEIRGLPSVITAYVQLLLGGATAIFAIKSRVWRDEKVREALLILIGFVGIPLIGFQFLHFNIWYLVGMMPAVVYFVAEIIKQLPKWLRISWASLLIVGAISYVINFHAVDKFIHAQNRAFLPIKIEAINAIREAAEGKPFSSYHYVSDIYDFSYQYLYLTDAIKGKRLPVEFAYEPNVAPYITQKSDLLQMIIDQNPNVASDEEPELIFYIVEEPQNSEFLEQWWDKQRYSEIIDEIELSKSVRLFVALPE